MKKILPTCLLLVTAINIVFAQIDISEPAGPYFDQKSPGMDPEVFAPGIISIEDRIEMGCTWSSDGTEFYFARSETPDVQSNWSIWEVQENEGVWSEPKIAPFSGIYRDFAPFITPDSKTMLFYRMNNQENETREGTWIIHWGDDSWGEPQFFVYAYCLTTRDFQTFYFTTESSDKTSKDIGQMTFDNGAFSQPTELPGDLNSHEWEAHSSISPDGSYMLFDRIESTFVSFLKDDGTWSQGYNLGKKLHVPSISPDGKFIFFSSDGDIYWVDAKIIEDVNPKYK